MRASSAGRRSWGSSRYRAPVIRRVGTNLADQYDEWQNGRFYFRPETTSAIDVLIPIEEVGRPLALAS
jgi:hypothetical protein